MTKQERIEKLFKPLFDIYRKKITPANEEFQWIKPEKMSSIKVIGHKEKPEGWHEDWHKDSSLASSKTYHNVIWDVSP